MVDYKVLITTSGLGSRLGSLTDYTNKCLIRVGDKPVISHLIESYPKNAKFIITLGHFKSHVRQFLELTYPEKNIDFVEIDRYSGEHSSLGYSLLKCKPFINGPFIYHASDTLILNENAFEFPDHNWVIGCKVNDTSQYSTIKTHNDFVLEINNKGDLSCDIPYIGVSGIKDYKEYFSHLDGLVKSNKFGTELSDIHVINLMLKTKKFKYKEIKSDNWHDTGNPFSLSRSRKIIGSSIEVLDKKDESIFFYDDFVVKFFYDKNININRVTRGKQLDGLVPEILDYTDNFYKYRKSVGNLFSKTVNVPSFIKFLEWSKNNLWIRGNVNGFKDICKKFYIEKTINRIKEYTKDIEDNPSIINGMSIPTAVEMLNIINKDWLCDGIPSKFHGDFILDNVIETNTGFCLIDWRQDFGGNLQFGDIYYDLAKLNHNLTINHSIVNNKLFKCNADECYIHINSKHKECSEVLYEFINKNGYDLNKVKVLTALIWINMATLHEYPFNIFLFNFGKYNLYKNLNEL